MEHWYYFIVEGTFESKPFVDKGILKAKSYTELVTHLETYHKVYNIKEMKIIMLSDITDIPQWIEKQELETDI